MTTLIPYADVILALGLLFGVMLVFVGAVKRSIGLEAVGMVAALLCLFFALRL